MAMTEEKRIKQSMIIFVAGLLLTIIISSILISSKPTQNPSQVQPPITPFRSPTKTLSIPTNTSSPTSVVLSACAGEYSIRIRRNPNIYTEILGGISPKECFSVYGRNESSTWVWIKVGEIRGWVTVEYISIDGEINQLSLVDENGVVKSIQLDLAADLDITQIATKIPTKTYTSPTRIKTSTPRPLPTASMLLCKDTYSKIGSSVKCKIPRAYCSYQPGVKGKPTFCNDARYPNHDFTLVVWGNDWSDLDGRCIIVSGRVSLYDGKPQIEATSRSQIAYCQ